MKYIADETTRFEYERIVRPIRAAYHDGELIW
jgi:hypothetical protein